MKERILYKTTPVQKDLKRIAEELLSGYFGPLSKGDPLSDLGALIDLLERCTHINHEVINGKNPGIFKHGHTKTSLAGLADDWGWSRSKVNKFLSKLERIGVIRLEPAIDGTDIFILL